MIQASGSAEKSLIPMNPFYEFPIADTTSSSVGRFSAKSFKHCNVQHSNTCKEAQSYQLLARLSWAPKHPPGGNGAAWTPRVEQPVWSLLMYRGQPKGHAEKTCLCIGRRTGLYPSQTEEGVRLKSALQDTSKHQRILGRKLFFSLESVDLERKSLSL